MAEAVADWLIRHGINDAADVGELLDLVSGIYSENLAVMLESLAKILRDRIRKP